MRLARFRTLRNRTSSALERSDPGFHDVPSGSAGPECDASGAGVIRVRFAARGARPRSLAKRHCLSTWLPTCGRREPGSGGRLCLPGSGAGDGTSESRRLARGALAGHTSAGPVPIRCCLPAEMRTASLLSVHKHVDDLCATAPGLCIGGGNAGDFAAWQEPGVGIYLGECE